MLPDRTSPVPGSAEQQAPRDLSAGAGALAEYDLPYTTGPLIRQFWHTVRTICKLSLPDRFLTATSDDAPETASEEKFRVPRLQPKVFGAHDVGTTRRGLDTANIDRAGLRMKQRRRRHASLRTAAVAALLRLF